MTPEALLRRFAVQCGATTSIEFAVVGSMMFMMTLGALDLGMLLWTQNAIQSAAAVAARCAAITPSSALCPDVPTYAANVANNWIMPGTVVTRNVTVTTVSACHGATGSFKQVSITTAFWANVLPWPFNSASVSASACFPK